MIGFGPGPDSRRRAATAPGRLVRTLCLVLSAGLAAVGIVAIQPVSRAEALDGSQFNAGYIIDDVNFYNANAMSQAQIQSFLAAKEGSCSNSNCLQLLSAQTSNKLLVRSSSTGNVRCGAYSGGSVESAAAIIFKVQQACGISAKALLVTLQKEQGLVTDPGPSDAAVSHAMGYACPDTAPCAQASLSFFEQVYQGALQLNTYRAAKFGKQPGLQTIAYSPNASCGSKTVVVSNYATAALYNYTPYTPNDAALANLNGTAPCGAYGNRNFWVYYSSWFGGPTGNPQGSVQSITVANNTVTLTGWAVDPEVPSGAIDVRVRGAGWSKVISADAVNSASQGAFAGAGTNHGFSATLFASTGGQQVCVDAVNQGLGTDVTLGCQNVTVPSTIATVTRLSGADRYSTAIEVSKANFQPGVSVVYVASGETFPDALSVVPIAAEKHAPLLLTIGSAVSDELFAELTRLRPHSIVMVGGTQAISSAAEARLATVPGLDMVAGEPNISRVEGVDRFQTSIAIGDSVFAPPAANATIAYIATGANFPDAISAAAAAGYTNAPLLLVDGSQNSVSSQAAAALTGWGVKTLVVVGGSSAISDQLFASLNAIAPATRVAGPDRYSTSAAVNAIAFPAPTSVYIATGDSFADGLTGGAVAGARGAPMLLAPGTCVPQGAMSQIFAWRTSSLTLLGGTSALEAGVESLTPC